MPFELFDKPSVGRGRHGNGSSNYGGLTRTVSRDMSGPGGGGDAWGLGINPDALNPDVGMEDLEQSLKDARARANGQMPTLSQEQLKYGQENALRGAVALASTGRGGNIGAQTAQASALGAGALASTNEDAAQMRVQEQQINEQQAAAIAQAISQQKYNNAALYNQTQLGLNQENIDWQLGKGALDVDRGRLQNERLSQWLGLGKSVIGAIGSAVGGAMGSDERMKHDIQHVPGEAAALVGELPDGIAFDYNSDVPEKPGRKVGFSAQELEKTSLGPQLVFDTPNGKMLDTRNAGVLALAAVSDLVKQQKQQGARTIDPFAGENADAGPRGYRGPTQTATPEEAPPEYEYEYEFGSPEELRNAHNQRIARTSRRADPFAGEGNATALAARDAARYAVAEDRNRMRRIYAIDPFA